MKFPLLALTLSVLMASFTIAPVQAQDEPLPFVEIFEFNGFFGCGIGFLSISTADACGQLSGTGGARHVVDPADESIQGAVFQLVWTPATPVTAPTLALVFPAAETLTPLYETDDHLVTVASFVWGSSPVKLTIRTGDPEDPVYSPAPGNHLDFQIRPVGSTLDAFTSDPLNSGNSGLVAAQPYYLLVSLFHHMDPPPGFSALA